jgi:Zn-dependent metalloprotease
LRRTSHRRTSHTAGTSQTVGNSRSAFASRSTRRKAAAGALVAVAALLAAAVQTGAATADTKPAPGKLDKGSLAVKLSPAQRAALIRDADSAKADTAKELGLGAQEKLVVRDVVKDADGTVHTRYERTYAGLPVLGGDLVVDTAKSGKTEALRVR